MNSYRVTYTEIIHRRAYYLVRASSEDEAVDLCLSGYGEMGDIKEKVHDRIDFRVDLEE